MRASNWPGRWARSTCGRPRGCRWPGRSQHSVRGESSGQTYAVDCSVLAGCYRCNAGAGSGVLVALGLQPGNADLPLLDDALVGGVELHTVSMAREKPRRDAHHCRDTSKLLIGGDGRRLHQELVSTFRIRRRVRLHCLEENWAGVSTAVI